MSQYQGRLTDKAQREVEELWTLRREAVEVLGLVVAEWRTDPQSVACFDLRMVDKGTKIMARLEVLEKTYGLNF